MTDELRRLREVVEKIRLPWSVHYDNNGQAYIRAGGFEVDLPAGLPPEDVVPVVNSIPALLDVVEIYHQVFPGDALDEALRAAIVKELECNE